MRLGEGGHFFFHRLIRNETIPILSKKKLRKTLGRGVTNSFQFFVGFSGWTQGVPADI